MSVISAFVKELRQRRLWPVVGVLSAAIIAAPIVLAKSPAPAPVHAPSVSGLPASGTSAGPSISLETPNPAPPSGPGRNPFTGSAGSGASASASAPSNGGATAAAAGTGATAAAAGTGAAGPTDSGSGGTSGSATQPTTPTTTTPTTGPSTPAHRPPPPGLTATQAYGVTLAITNSAGGLDKIDPLDRLSVLPSRQQPLLVELGVLQGGGRVLFAVQPDAVVSGPGSCLPGPIDCQILSLAAGQTETLSSTSGAVSHVLFAVTAITADQYPSTAAAAAARQKASAAGRKLLSTSTLSALSLFRYDPTLGAVVDLRNLRVGG